MGTGVLCGPAGESQGLEWEAEELISASDRCVALLLLREKPTEELTSWFLVLILALSLFPTCPLLCFNPLVEGMSFSRL